MDEWWTYELQDLILFSSQTYYRLVELYNIAVWPVHILSALLSIALLYLLIKRPPNHGKIVTTILLASWLWVAWAFLWQRFTSIHWISSYYALGFVIQSVLLFWAGLIKDKLCVQTSLSIQYKLGSAITVFALFVQPFVMLLAGNNWKQAELFAITPDSTVMATMGLLLLTDLKNTAWLLVLPLLWCIVSAATLYVLGSLAALGLIFAALLITVTLILRKTHPSLIS